MEKFMMRKSLPVFFFIITLSVANVFAQRVYTPKKGSAERKAIINTIRVPVEKELRQKIIFVISDFNVSGNWAFIGGEPRSKKTGGMPNYKGTEYQNAIESDVFDNNVFALFKKSGKKWKVVSYYIGCTDVCYAGWWKQFKAPKRIFPYTE
jgi:hypothetical protein